MAKLMLLAALVGGIISSPAPQLSARAICAGPYDVSGGLDHVHLDLVIQGENIATEPDGVWTTLTDIESGEIAILAYNGSDSKYTGVVVHEVTVPHWGTTSFPLVYGHEYLAQVWRGEYTVMIPDLSDLITEVSVTMPATCYQYFVPLILR